jgi:ribonucleoside-diphosphate reductase alpha chain
MGKSGGCASSNAESVARLISLALRAGVDPKSVAEQLRGIRCPAPTWSDGEMILSCADAIGRVLEKAIVEIENGAPGMRALPEAPASAAPATSVAYTSGTSGLDMGHCPQCPECGGMMEHEGGCAVCRGCGFSKCG